MFLSQGYKLIGEEWIYLCTTAILLIFFITGKKLVIVSAITAAILPKFENVFGCGSISTPLFVYFGIFLSMWTWMLNKYKLDKEENHLLGLQVLDKLYWFLFASYGILNLLSAYVHIKDPYWQSGDAMEMFYTHHFWGKWYEEFRNLHGPAWWNHFMHWLSWSVLASQLLLIPAYLFKWSRKLLFIWFIILIINIAFLLRVVFLPHFTLFLFVLLFFKRSPQFYGKDLFKIDHKLPELRHFFKVFYVVGGVLLMLKTPVVSQGVDKVFWFVREWDTRVWLMKKTSQIGYFQPVVINADHLEGHKRFVLYRQNTKNKLELVPILSPKGKRLSYWPDPLFSENQGIEQIYANTMGHITGYDSFTYENSPTPYKFRQRAIHRLIMLDYRATLSKDSAVYVVQFYERRKPSTSGKPSWDYSDTLMGKFTYVYWGDSDKFKIIRHLEKSR